MWQRKEFGERFFGWFCQIPVKGKQRTLPHLRWNVIS
jgi:hypothetical protein